ncbi:hypothetical protein A4A49_02256 [Nicotiana attenuata]|uniref:Uncharacterized protein n=1 Tax=Nicotiana attenuata TaxID=49451 RepID=A0A314L1I1_NICAT|nr:hypothetical protein A4A49_02256 [Nicotiana attenuata]
MSETNLLESAEINHNLTLNCSRISINLTALSFLLAFQNFLFFLVVYGFSRSVLFYVTVCVGETRRGMRSVYK